MEDKKYITVFCGSNTGTKPSYITESKQLAKALYDNQYHLMFGAGNVGLMGVIADEILALGGEAVGVIPQHLVDREVAHTGLTELIVTNTMHERKAIMAERTNGFIAMPGGIGTLEEIIEVMTWSQLDLHPYPVSFFNIDGYYDKLFEFMQHMVDDGFLKQVHIDKLILDSDPVRLVARIKEYEHEYVAKWL